MGRYRVIQMDFWSDTDVLDEFTPEDRYFYLYLMTNPHTNLAGCYEISIRNIVMETGYSNETVWKLLDRMEKVHKKVIYSEDTKELLLVNWSRHNWTSSPKYRKPLLNEINLIKDSDFKSFLKDLFDGKDTVCIPYRYGIDTSITITTTNTNTITNTIAEKIIGYLNAKAGKNFSKKSKSHIEHINGRISEGYKEEDFYKVIDNKVAEWKGSKMEKFLRPNTLFAPSHFDEYLNQGEKVEDDLEAWAEE